jgi:hypothetical protein
MCTHHRSVSALLSVLATSSLIVALELLARMASPV